MNIITQHTTIESLAVSLGAVFGYQLPRPIGVVDTSNNPSEPPM